MSHTKGPWHVVDGTEFVSDDHHMAICRVNEIVSFGSHGKSRSNGPRSRDGNARLIAAAPDLLQACQAFVGFYDLATKGISSIVLPGEWIDKAKAAIAKATVSPEEASHV